MEYKVRWLPEEQYTFLKRAFISFITLYILYFVVNIIYHYTSISILIFFYFIIRFLLPFSYALVVYPVIGSYVVYHKKISRNKWLPGPYFTIVYRNITLTFSLLIFVAIIHLFLFLNNIDFVFQIFVTVLFFMMLILFSFYIYDKKIFKKYNSKLLTFEHSPDNFELINDQISKAIKNNNIDFNLITQFKSKYYPQNMFFNKYDLNKWDIEVLITISQAELFRELGIWVLVGKITDQNVKEIDNIKSIIDKVINNIEKKRE